MPLPPRRQMYCMETVHGVMGIDILIPIPIVQDRIHFLRLIAIIPRPLHITGERLIMEDRLIVEDLFIMEDPLTMDLPAMNLPMYLHMFTTAFHLGPIAAITDGTTEGMEMAVTLPILQPLI